MDDLLGNKPFMSPITTVSFTGKRTLSESECSTSSDEKQECSKLLNLILLFKLV